MRFSKIEKAILLCLTWQTRCVSVESLAQSVLPTNPDRIGRAIRTLRRKKLVECRRVVAMVYELEYPLVTSDRLDNVFDAGHIAWQLADRWKRADRRTKQVVWATRNAVRIVGGCSGRRRQLLQIQHDLGVADVLAVRGTHKDETWVGEDAYRVYVRKQPYGKVPDAVILNHDQIQRVIEFGGRYSREQLLKFHRYWNALRLPYELW